MKLRIAVDMHFLQDKAQGIATVLRGVYWALARKRPDYEFIFLFQHFDKISEKWSQIGEVVSLGDASRIRRLSNGVGKAINASGGADLTHVNSVVPFNVPTRVVLTLHDLLFMSHPSYFGVYFRMSQRMALSYSVRRADAVATVSNYTREALLKNYPSLHNKTFCIPNGVDAKSMDSGNLANHMESIKEDDALTAGYILTVSRIDKRKNHATMLEAYTDFVARCGPYKVPQMVVVGSVDNRFWEGEKLLKEYESSAGIVWLRGVSDDKLKYLYKNAGIFVMASHAEGFGLPILEAMAMNIPVIAGNNTAMRELVSDAGVLVNSDDSKELSQAYEELFYNHDLREKCKAAGKRRAREYTWEQSADNYQKLFDAVVRDSMLGKH